MYISYEEYYSDVRFSGGDGKSTEIAVMGQDDPVLRNGDANQFNVGDARKSTGQHVAHVVTCVKEVETTSAWMFSSARNAADRRFTR